jgi:hypothetical protein
MSIPMMGSAIGMIGVHPDPIQDPHDAMLNLSKIYGNIMTVFLGDDDWIVLSGFDEIKAFSMNSEAIQRPHNATLMSLYSFDEPLGNYKALPVFYF